MSKPWRYVAIDVESQFFEEEVFASRDAGMLGLSITMPHKDAAFALVKSMDEVAQKSGSVNTIIFDGTGVMRGANTDGDGCCDALERFGAVIENCRAVRLIMAISAAPRFPKAAITARAVPPAPTTTARQFSITPPNVQRLLALDH